MRDIFLEEVELYEGVSLLEGLSAIVHTIIYIRLESDGLADNRRTSHLDITYAVCRRMAHVVDEAIQKAINKGTRVQMGPDLFKFSLVLDLSTKTPKERQSWWGFFKEESHIVERWHIPLIINNQLLPDVVLLDANENDHGVGDDDDDDLNQCSGFRYLSSVTTSCNPQLLSLVGNSIEVSGERGGPVLTPPPPPTDSHDISCGGLRVDEIERLKAFLQQRKQVVQCLAHIIEATNISYHYLPAGSQPMKFSLTCEVKTEEHVTSSLTKLLSLQPKE